MALVGRGHRGETASARRPTRRISLWEGTSSTLALARRAGARAPWRGRAAARCSRAGRRRSACRSRGCCPPSRSRASPRSPPRRARRACRPSPHLRAEPATGRTGAWRWWARPEVDDAHRPRPPVDEQAERDRVVLEEDLLDRLLLDAPRFCRHVATSPLSSSGLHSRGESCKVERPVPRARTREVNANVEAIRGLGGRLQNGKRERNVNGRKTQASHGMHQDADASGAQDDQPRASASADAELLQASVRRFFGMETSVGIPPDSPSSSRKLTPLS